MGIETNKHKGHGRNACPGRFLASNELKVALVHLVLKYDWKHDEKDDKPKFLPFELANTTNPEMKLMLRRRKEEIKLDLDLGPDRFDGDE
jgi:cytochrome P450